MKYIALLILTSFSLDPTTIFAQGCGAGPLNGNVIGYRARIHDNTNTCACAAYVLPHTLHLLDSDEPSLRLSYNYLGGTCPGDIHGDIAIVENVGTYSTIANSNDFIFVADETASNIVISTMQGGKRIIFGTAQTTGSDVERATITDIGHLGVATTDPKELFQVGSKSVWHVGFDDDYIGYNVFTNGLGNLERHTSGYTARLEFEKDGRVYLGMAGTGNGGTAAVFEESAGRYRGLSMKHNASGDGVFAFGVTFPDNSTRLTVRSHGDDETTNAFLIQNSGGSQLVRTYSDGKVLIGTGAAHSELDGPGLQVKGNVIIGLKMDEEDWQDDFENALMVDGIIFAREVAVQIDNWSDYVFDEEYNLMPLNELQQFIRENHHLPKIPNQEEVSKNGIRMAEFQAAILAKVEELTLYVIQLSDENIALRKQIQALSNSNK